MSVALGLTLHEGRWLVSRRAPGRVFEGLWEFPGGKIAPGETPGAAAVRETREETGVLVEPVGNLGTLESPQSETTFILHLISCVYIQGAARPQDPAVAEVRWVTLAEARELPMPPVNERILDRLACWASSSSVSGDPAADPPA